MDKHIINTSYSYCNSIHPVLTSTVNHEYIVSGTNTLRVSGNDSFLGNVSPFSHVFFTDLAFTCKILLNNPAPAESL